MTRAWSPDSWQRREARQVPEYEDAGALAEALERLSCQPPLVFAGEVRALTAMLARAAQGDAFLLQGGDCAESFSEFSADNIRDTFRLFLQMAIVLTYAAKRPVIKIGRIAGQFAKPRSSPMETFGGQELPSFRGDIINDATFTAAARKHDPARMMAAYAQSATTLNLLRAYAHGGFADLSRVASWNLAFVNGTPEAERYQAIAGKIDAALRFMAACGIDAANTKRMQEVDFYTSHEALLLPYEEKLTRVDASSGDVIAGSAHFLWIGDRTRQVDGAHVEYCRGIRNPLGLKCGPSLAPDELLRLIDVLNPENEPGRLTLIGRFGANAITRHLPPLARAVAREGRIVLWACDPMHGNTIRSASGYKTRPFDRILSEARSFFRILQAEDLHPGGIHVEMTGKNVTECTGGMQKLGDSDLAERYHTAVDPRLNASQGLELAFLIAEEMEAVADRGGGTESAA